MSKCKGRASFDGGSIVIYATSAERERDQDRHHSGRVVLLLFVLVISVILGFSEPELLLVRHF